ncbi:hypothetical protein [Streptomyces sp. NPDC012466]|uniref:hypothetical protein n=1 Tax=Streptomyces sp. NPDC012466 TaxID=3364835 RepID=UPI0036F09125
MSIRSRRSKPRLVPELDDKGLGQTLKLLHRLPTPNMVDIQVDTIAATLREADARKDWDRKAHRLVILGEAVAEGQLPERWLRRQPDDGDARLFKAWVDVIRGRLTGSVAGAEIADSCHRAAAENPVDPTPWTVLLALLRLLRRPIPEIVSVWSEVVDRDPWNRCAYWEMLDYLSPEECGSHLQWMEFIDSVRDRTPADAPTAGLELTAVVQRHVKVVMRGGVQGLMAARSSWSQPWESAALERASQLWLRPGFLRHASALADLNTLAYALVEAEQLSDAAAVFDALDGVVTSWPWETSGDAVQHYTKALERVRRRQAV